jgi:hypothetical protein
VTKGRFVASVDEDGKTRVRERYVVAAPLSGRLVARFSSNTNADEPPESWNVAAPVTASC